MHDTLSADEAIAKGKRRVLIPSILILMAVLGATVYVAVENLLPPWTFPIGFALALVLAWLYWSIMITKWRIWAFEQVRNVHELQKKATRENLIWPGSSFFTKTEIWTGGDHDKWLSLQEKFARDDVFINDYSVPSETIIGYSKGKNYFEMAIMLGCLGLGIYLLVQTDSYIFGSFVVIFGGWRAYIEYGQANNTEPQIILSDEGIQTSSTPFYEWKDIPRAECVSRPAGKTTQYYLSYKYPGGSEYLRIDDFETTQHTLNNLIDLYRGRYNDKHKNVNANS